MPVVGFLSSLAQSDLGLVIPGFQEGLNGAGFVEGRNIAIEYRWAEGDYQRLPALAADLVNRKVQRHARDAGGKGGNNNNSFSLLLPKSGTSIDPARISVAAYLDRWLAHMRSQISPRTYELYGESIANTVPHIGHVLLSNCSRMRSQRCMQRRWKGAAGGAKAWHRAPSK